MIRLTEAQRAAAIALKTERPAVIEGTNVIADDDERRAWYLKVRQRMKERNVSDMLVKEFCDLAGVPD